MNEKPVKVPMDFNEALRRIAKTPKSVVDQNKAVVNRDRKVYNVTETAKKPSPPTKRKP